jgi:hypothetical protein
MKVITLGEQSGSYGDVVLQEGKKANKFGKMFYLKDRIYLIQRKPITDYNIWESDRNEKHLRLALNPELKEELMKITAAFLSKMPGAEFKDHCEGDSIFIKLGKQCTSVELNAELQCTIQIYGCFSQTSSGKTYLQMDIMEQQSTKFSLLNSNKHGLNYEPNSKAWEESDKF